MCSESFPFLYVLKISFLFIEKYTFDGPETG